MRQVIVNIDSLVLKGFRYEDRYAVAAGLRAELLKRFASPVIAQRMVEKKHIPKLRINMVPLRADTSPRQVGAATAKAIGRGLEK